MLSSWLLLLAGLVAVSMAQMTFSDGWGNMKRSVPIFKRLVPVAELRDAETQTGTEGRQTIVSPEATYPGHPSPSRVCIFQARPAP